MVRKWLLSSCAFVALVSASQAPVVTHIDVDFLPLYGVITGDSRYLYVTHNSTEQLSIIDTQSQTVVETIDVPSPYRIYISPDSRYVYVTGFTSDLVVVDTRTNETSLVPTDGVPVVVTNTADSQSAYVSIEAAHTVDVMDTATHTKITSIPVDERPWAGVSSPDSSKIYVLSFEESTVAAIDTSKYEVVTIPLSTEASPERNEGPFDITITPDGKYLYTVNEASDTAHIIDTATNTEIKVLSVGDKPWSIELTPDARYAYVGSAAGEHVTVIDTAKMEVIASIEVGLAPVEVAPTPDGKYVYVLNGASSSVSVIEVASQSVVSTIDVGASPLDLIMSPDGRYVYTVNVIDYSVTAILTLSAIDAITYEVGQVQSIGCTEHFATLSWGAIAGIDMFKVYRGEALVATLPGTARGYTEHNLMSNESEGYRLEVITNEGASYSYEVQRG